jgi:hypothetical protein
MNEQTNESTEQPPAARSLRTRLVGWTDFGNLR